MSLDLDAVKRRYTETVSVTDAFGRAIKIGRLRPSQHLKAGEMAMNDAAGNMVRLVCYVRAVDDKDFGFPENRAVVNSRLDMLEDEGLAAILGGLKTLLGVDQDSDEKAPASVGEAAKNS